MQGISLNDLLGQSISTGEGISLDDLLGVQNPKEIQYQNYLDVEKDWIDINDCWVIDSETYHLNSKVRCIQIYNTKDKIVYFIVDGEIEKTVKNQVIREIQERGFVLNIIECENEEQVFREVLKTLIENPKDWIGHNLSHFDLGLIHSKIKMDGKYTLAKEFQLYLKGYNVGSGRGNRKGYFSYLLGENNDKEGMRYRIVDTMYIAFTLFIPASLQELSKDAEKKVLEILDNFVSFPKQEVDYKEFENRKLSYNAVIYSIYDVLGIIQVYRYLKMIIEGITQKYLKINQKASQLLCEHVWMKGAGSIAEAYLSKFLGRIPPNVPDFLTKYFGGMTRVWHHSLITAKGIEQDSIRQLDFTSDYPFAIVYQNIFDILNGDFVYLHKKKIKYDSEEYRKLIYSSTLILKCKQKCDLVIEIDAHKKNGMVSLGFVRSFYEQGKVQELEHTLGSLRCRRNEKVVLTKAELEMNLGLNPILLRNYFDLLIVQDGLYATNNEKTKEYIQLYPERKALQKQENPAEYGVKVILNSIYGKLAQNTSDFFHLASASAITAFARVQLFLTCLYAIKIGIVLLYSDTDSLYGQGTLTQFKKLIIYGDKLNPYPKLMYGIDNLKDEGENIICFHPIKRKRYSKIYYNKKGELKIKIKGENGNSDYRWRDILFRISMMCGGAITIQEIQENIKNREFSFNIPIKQNFLSLYEEKKKIKEDIKEIKRQLTIIKREYKKFESEIIDLDGVQGLEEWKEGIVITENINEGVLIQEELSNNSKLLYQDLKYREERLEEINDILEFNYLSLFKQVYKKYSDKLLSELIHELDSKAKIIMMFNVHFKTSINYINGVYYDKIRRAWEQKTGESAYVGCFFSINRNIVRQIKVVEVEDKKTKRKEKIKKTYYFGTFKPKSAEDFSYEINLPTYITEFDFIPIILNKDYWQILHRNINLDTIVLKTSHPIGLWNLSKDDKNAVTRQSFNFPHNGKRYVSHLYNPSLFVKLRLKDISNFNFDLGPIVIKEMIEDDSKKKKFIWKKGFLTGKVNWENDNEVWAKNFPYLQWLKDSKDDYVNTHLFIQNIVRFESVIRFNKYRLFNIKNANNENLRNENGDVIVQGNDWKTNIFSIYRTFDKLAKVAQYTIERMFELRKIKLIMPRFLFLAQIDVCQECTQEFNKKLYMESYGQPFVRKNIGYFIQADFCKYMSLTSYHKAASANYKLENKKMDEREMAYFKWESEEEWRSEIKFRLQRNYYESLSYIYILSLIKTKYFLQFIRDYKQIKKQKKPRFKISSYLSGKIRIDKKSTLILFQPYKLENLLLIQFLSGRKNFVSTEKNNYYQEYSPNPLEGRGLLRPPPLQKTKKINMNMSNQLNRKRKKMENTSEFFIDWTFSEEDFKIENTKNAEILFSEVFSRY